MAILDFTVTFLMHQYNAPTILQRYVVTFSISLEKLDHNKNYTKLAKRVRAPTVFFCIENIEKVLWQL